MPLLYLTHESANRRPLGLRMRSDLVVAGRWAGPQCSWTIKDPVSLRYVQLRDEEYFVLRQLDGDTSLEDIRRRFAQAFPPQRLSGDRLQAFLGTLHQQGLIVSDAAGQAEQLLERRSRRRWAAWTGAVTNVLAIRFRGADPERFLNWLAPRCGWIFSPWTLTAAALLVLSALLLVIVQYDVLRSRLPAFGDFLTPGNLVWLAAALAFAKVLHELGHALACKRFGGECHEIGLMLLVFTPCLYCNVSDAWLLPNKWHRAAIAAAGIGVELVLAAVCTFLWWFSQPGLFNTLCLNVMVVCSVSTLLFNGNPLLRYDGYYVLSDLWGVPNLWEESRAVLRRKLAWWCLGLESDDRRLLPETRRGPLMAYAIASTIYRWGVLCVILWFLHRTLKPHGLEVVAQLLTGVVLAGLLAGPIKTARRLLSNPLRRQQVRRSRLGLSGLLAAVVLAAVMFVPVPFSVTAPAVLEPQDARRVYVSVPGTLVDAVRPGEAVAVGDVLGRLVNRELELEVEKLAGRHRQQMVRLAHLESRRGQDPEIAAQIPTAREALADLTDRLRQLRADERRLVLTAPAAGTVLPPPVRPIVAERQGELAEWSGTPLDERNRGSFLEAGTLVCLVGDSDRLEAVLVVDQGDVEFVQPGQRVRLWLDEAPGTIVSGRITEVARIDLKLAPRELSDRTGGDLPTRTDRHGHPRLLETSYHARVSLDPHGRKFLIGTRGRAKIVADPEPLGRRLYRWLRRTFRFQL